MKIQVKYQCIKCKKIWIMEKECKSGQKPKNQDNLFSHGLCRACLINSLSPKIHRNQRSQGYNDCFGKSEEIFNKKCPYTDCCYYDICNNFTEKDYIVLDSDFCDQP